ncbi:MAG: SET domain-containing protein-lysine N-methyltransferase [Gammaproteobacteria bacterium]
MNKKLFQNKLAVRKSPIHGYGVFAEKDIRKGEKIEECYFILSDCEDDIIMDFIFDAGGRSALLLGYGSLYNHSENPNADYIINRKTRIATFTAAEAIKKGQEIFVSYGDEWFSSRGVKKKELKPKKRKRR